MIASSRVRSRLAVALAFLLLGGLAAARAEGLKSAQVSRIFNEVKLLPDGQPPRAATVSDTVSGKAAVQTGAASRTELMFTDKTLTRLGANSFFSFVNGTRDMNLGSGTMLLQVPKGAGGAEIHTAAVTAAITGTTLMVEFNPKSYSKIIVLEGTVRVYLTGHVGESILVHAGQMVIVPPDSKLLPDPVSVDLRVLYATSGLINDFGPLASTKLIDHEITRQKKDIDGGKLTDTNLFIVGRGTVVQEGHISFVSGNDHSITARQGAHTPLGLNETREPLPPPIPLPTPVETPTPPPRTPTPPPTAPPPTPSTPTPPPPTPSTPTPPPTPPPVTPSPTPSTPTPPPVTPSPTVVPTATPSTPTPPPTATPSPTVIPTPTPPPPTPGSTKNGPLPLIANNPGGNNTQYALNGSTVIRTDPFITTQGVTDEGRIYRGGTVASPATANSPDGLPSNYFLGATGGPTAFDTQVGFNTQFGTIGDIGGFKFSNLVLLGNPASISTVDGPTNLALITTGGMTDSLGEERPAGGPQAVPTATNTFDLKGLNQVLFATQDGAINFFSGLSFLNSGTTVPTLTLYTRGGSVGIGGNSTFILPGSALNLYGEGGVFLSGSVGTANTAGAGAVNLISGGILRVDGVVHSTGSITATTVAGSQGFLGLAESSSILTDAGDFNATSDGEINAQGTITTGGDTRLVAASDLSVTGNISTGGNLRLRANNGDVVTDANSVFSVGGVFGAIAGTGSVTLNGTVGQSETDFTATTPTAANVSAGSDVTLAGDLAATDSISISSTGGNVTQGGGTIYAVGETPGGTPTPGTVTVTTGGGNIDLNSGSLSGNTVTITTTGGNITKLDDHTLFTNAGDLTLTSTNGTVTLGGTVESAAAILARAGGDLTLQGAAVLGGLDANVTFTSTGGNILIDEDSSVNMNGGTFTANASGTLTIDGTVGRLAFGRGLGAGGVNAAVTNEPDYATATAGNGIVVNGSIATGGTGGGESTDEDGIELTALGGNLRVVGALETFGGGINLRANNGALTVSGTVYSAGGFEATSQGDMTFSGSVYGTGGSVQGTSNQGALNVGPFGYVSASGDITLFGSASLSIANNVNAGVVADLSTFGPLSVSGNVSANDHFSATTYGGALTLDGHTVASRPVTSAGPGLNPSNYGVASFYATGPFGTVSSLSAPDRNNGTMFINGQVNVGVGEIDFTAGTTFTNDPLGSSITATHVEITAGTTATINFSRFYYGGISEPRVMNVHAQTIMGTTDSLTYGQVFSPLNLYATNAITLGGVLNVTTLQGGNLTLLPASRLTVLNLNTTVPTGAVVIGNNSYFQLNAGTNANSVGPVTLDGSPILQLNGSLAAAGGISTTAANQTPTLNLSTGVTLTATGSVSLGAGSLSGSTGSVLGTNSNFTTTGSAQVQTLNAFGGFTLGSLSAQTVTAQNIGGTANPDPANSTVNGDVTSYLPAGMNTFTIGQLTANRLNYAGSTASGSLNASSLTLNVRGDFGVGRSVSTPGTTGFVGSADFSGATVSANTNGLTAGNGGTLTVTTTANPAAFPAPLPGAIRIQDNGAGVVPVITSMGGNLVPVNNSIAGKGGAGGTLVLNSAGLLSVGSGTTVTAAGGNFADTPSTLYFGGAANDGGAGGVVTLNAGSTLALAGGTGTAGTTTGPVTVSAQGGDSLYSNSGTGGRGGTVNLRGVDGVSLTNTAVNAGGGSNRQGTLSGDPAGGTISVASSGASSAVTTVAITGSTLFASNGVAGTQTFGTGGTITILSNDATVGPAPSPTPVPAVAISSSTLTASQDGPTGTPGAGSGSVTGGTINVTSRRTGGTGIAIDGSRLLVGTNVSAGGTGGHINLTTSGSDILLTNSSTLHATGAGSNVTLSTGGTGTNGGTITLNGANVNTSNYVGGASTGPVSLVTGSATATGISAITVFGSSSLQGTALSMQALGSQGAISLANCTLNADTLKMQALGTSGTIVINGGSTLSAATQLTLYAGSTGRTGGTITFQGGTITLNTGTLAGSLAADTINVRAGTTVTVNGSQRLLVYTNNPNYTGSGGNGTQSGTFAGSAAPTGSPAPFSSAPVPSALRPGQGQAVVKTNAALGVVKPAGKARSQSRMLVLPAHQGWTPPVLRITPVSKSAVLDSRSVLAGPGSRNMLARPDDRAKALLAKSDERTRSVKPTNRPTVGAGLRP